MSYSFYYLRIRTNEPIAATPTKIKEEQGSNNSDIKAVIGKNNNAQPQEGSGRN